MTENNHEAYKPKETTQTSLSNSERDAIYTQGYNKGYQIGYRQGFTDGSSRPQTPSSAGYNPYKQNPYQQTSELQPVQHQSKGVGIAGFVLSMIGLTFFFISFAVWPASAITMFISTIFFIISFILTFVGVFRAPRGLAIAGLIIATLALILYLYLWLTSSYWYLFS